ncbi:MAG: DUF481 domain-containing protein [Candidatus Omnitrophica bacterium]|nr:DUF481 domain-containing protein [Candidatus Omnitrophota bacterium]
MKSVNVLVVFVFLLIVIPFVHADEIYLNNGDKITGKVTADSGDTITLSTEAAGTITVKREFVEKVMTDEAIETAQRKEQARSLWEKDVALGYSQANGNTQNRQFSAQVQAIRKTDSDEFTIKGNSYYGSTNKKMDTQKWYGMLRYGQSWTNRKWYRFVKLEADHDYFGNIDYRLIPSSGIGYWFADTEEWKARLEMAAGFEHTHFRDTTKNKNEFVLVPRAFLEKQLFENTTLSEDITVYPSLEKFSAYRVRSETALVNALNEHLSLKVSFIWDYDAEPSLGTKESDTQLISSLVYSW